MNIFYLDHNTTICAQYHNNKHVVKMIVEYSQILSTAHRILDGIEYIDKTENGRKIKRWRLLDNREYLLYKATHINHPSTIWARINNQNYSWLSSLLNELCKEYTYRYNKKHKCESSGLCDSLNNLPNNISTGEFFEPTQAMPDKYKVKNNSILAYHNYYLNDKQHIAKWGAKNNRKIPDWYNVQDSFNFPKTSI